MGLFKSLKKKIFGVSNEQKSKYLVGLDKSRSSLSSKFKALAARYKEVDEAYFEEVEEILIESDISVNLVLEIVDSTKAQCRLDKVSDPSTINEIVVDKIFIAYTKDQMIESELKLQDGLTVILMIGVNGAGKTTSIAKLAHRYKNLGKKVIVAAGDTFRAAAIDQLEVWTNRVGVELVKKENGSDPSSVMFDAVKRATEVGADVLICDTAGRLQTKSNLMQELAKIYRVLGRDVPGSPHEVLLVIDATTGQNGLSQAKAFTEACKITGIILTKMDGTAKGGIALSIKDQFDIPVRFIGLGEKMDDLIEFDLEEYLYSLFKDVIIDSGGNNDE